MVKMLSPARWVTGALHNSTVAQPGLPVAPMWDPKEPFLLRILSRGMRASAFDEDPGSWSQAENAFGPSSPKVRRPTRALSLTNASVAVVHSGTGLLRREAGSFEQYRGGG
jgi:hypothetical protein